MANNDATKLENVVCKCGKKFAINRIFKHLAKNPCKDEFSYKELETLKLQSKNFSKLKKLTTKAINYEKDKVKFKAKNKIHYEENKSEILKKTKIHYEKNTQTS